MMRLQSAQKWVISVLTVGIAILMASSAAAGKPEYMKLDLSPGNALEIKGYWEESAAFIATDIEALPKPRRPKLRGAIQDVDYNRHTITIFGLRVKVTDKTEFVDDGSSKTGFDSLKTKQRLEVSCMVDSGGNWIARKIKSKGVKRSNKIKGTISSVSVDGEAPDTVSMSGLLIILDRKTDVNDSHSHLDQIENEVYGDLTRRGSTGFVDGVVLGGEHAVVGEYRQNFRSEREFDLSDQQDLDHDDVQPEARAELSSYWTENLQSFAQLRLRKKMVISSDNNASSGDVQLQLTQLYAIVRNLGINGLSLQIGRQDFEDEREWLFDDYLDAARVRYYGLKPWLFEFAYIDAVEPLKAKLETWQDLLGRASFYLDRESVISAYILTRKDSDARNREPSYYGLSAFGTVGSIVRPWAELAIMRGEDKGRSLDAWAMDLGATVTIEHTRFTPVLSLGYAVGSGDDNRGDAIDHRFRQSGYQDNYATLGGISSVRYYGTLLDPELSNIKIATAAAAIRPTDNSSVEILYHSYKQQAANKRIKGSNLDTVPLGVDNDLGWAVDLVVGLKNLWYGISGSWTIAFFNPGVAFEPFSPNNAFLNKFNLTLVF